MLNLYSITIAGFPDRASGHALRQTVRVVRSGDDAAVVAVVVPDERKCAQVLFDSQNWCSKTSKKVQY